MLWACDCCSLQRPDIHRPRRGEVPPTRMPSRDVVCWDDLDAGKREEHGEESDRAVVVRVPESLQRVIRYARACVESEHSDDSEAKLGCIEMDGASPTQ